MTEANLLNELQRTIVKFLEKSGSSSLTSLVNELEVEHGKLLAEMSILEMNGVVREDVSGKFCLVE